MRAILDLWDKHRSLLLLELSAARQKGPVDVEHWKNNVAMEVEKAEERLLNGWHRQVIALFSGEGNLAKGVRPGQQEGFHECVSTLISNQVRAGLSSPWSAGYENGFENSQPSCLSAVSSSLP